LDNCKKLAAAITSRKKRKKGSDSTESTLFAPQQQQLVIPRLTLYTEHILNVLAARAIYENNLPFTTFEKYPMTKLLFRLNSAYKPPTAFELANSLLDEVYKTVKEEVDTIIDDEECLGVTFDETSNVNSERILNITIFTRRGIFYYLNLVLPAETLSSQRTTEIVYEKLLSISNRKIQRINAISTDTCPAMLSVWRLLSRQPGLQQCLMIPCDSHGLQLLIMDILSTAPFNEIKSKANQIIGHFKHSPKQVSILRDIQKKVYNKTQALTMANQTRWGTHYKEFQSILINKQALRRWAIDPRLDFKPTDSSTAIGKLVTDLSFFTDLKELINILTPIHHAQFESEADNAHLGLVRARWTQIESHLTTCKALSTFDFTPLIEKYRKRYKRQVIDIHHLAYWLCPTNVLIDRFKPDELTTVLATLRRFISVDLWADVELSFLHYYQRQGLFAETNTNWDRKNDIQLFWLLYCDAARPLAEFAMRISKATANSVPSERAFSSMKAVHSLTRNRLTPERVNKLLFITVNTKILNRGKKMDVEEDWTEDATEDVLESELPYVLGPIDTRTASNVAETVQEAPNALLGLTATPSSAISLPDAVISPPQAVGDMDIQHFMNAAQIVSMDWPSLDILLGILI
jgi:Protein of unknown function (DUF 659)/hAT family C-terminal dimerisation region